MRDCGFLQQFRQTVVFLRQFSVGVCDDVLHRPGEVSGMASYGHVGAMKIIHLRGVVSHTAISNELGNRDLRCGNFFTGIGDDIVDQLTYNPL